jgi:hypothetical protein
VLREDSPEIAAILPPEFFLSGKNRIEESVSYWAKEHPFVVRSEIFDLTAFILGRFAFVESQWFRRLSIILLAKRYKADLA